MVVGDWERGDCVGLRRGEGGVCGGSVDRRLLLKTEM